MDPAIPITPVVPLDRMPGKLASGLPRLPGKQDGRIAATRRTHRLMYIAIEGPKGCGKSTLMEHLPQRLRDYGVSVALLCPTRPMPPEHSLEQQAAGSDDDALRERLYAACSNYHAARVDRDVTLILGDRSILTSYVTRWEHAPGGQKRQWIERVDRLENLIGLPDHVLQLHVPEPLLLGRLQARHERDYGKHDETPERLRATLKAYAELRNHADELGLEDIVWHDIDASVSPGRVLARVVVRILEILTREGLLATALKAG